MKSNLRVCEFCEFSCEQSDSRFLRCLLDKEEKGLFEFCEKFKERTGENVTI